MDTSILRKLSYGVYVISTWDNGRLPAAQQTV